MSEIYKDRTASPRDRAKDLVARMNLDEKIAQMRLSIEDLAPFDPEDFGKKFPHGLGAVYATDGLDREGVKKLQAFAAEHSRFGIPMMVMSESIHGLMNPRATSFPQAIGLGAMFNPPLMEEIAHCIGRESRYFGVTENFAPDLDLSREPRWGRVEENYGEDPYLTSRYAAAYVKGLQAEGVAACPKHYCAHGSPESGINLAPVHAGERELREVFLEPFEAAFKEAGALSCMPAYSELDGVPLHTSRFLLTDVLRDELGFEGFTVSDFGAVGMLYDFHHVAENALDAGIQTVTAGLDMEACSPFGFGEEFKAAAAQGKVDMALIDQAVERILYVKFKLGLFENPVGEAEEPNGEQAQALSLKAALESVVLLKNDRDLLPLNRDIKKVALIGPTVKTAQLGDYTSVDACKKAVNLYDGVAGIVGEDRIIYARGADFARATDAQIAEAVAAAKSAEVAVLSLGDNSYYCAGIGWGDDSGVGGKAAVTCGEGFDSCSLTLPGRQQELLEAVVATGTPVVLILTTGRPYAITWASEHVPAIMQAWYPGEKGGIALAKLLFGLENPSGKLPISFPRSVGHVPCFYNHKLSAKGFYHVPGAPDRPGRDYIFDSPAALYPFGHGLSYTGFCYSDLHVDVHNETRTATVHVTVENTGKRAGKETVMVFVRDSVCRITPFVKRLRAFEKVSIGRNEKKTLTFELPFTAFAFINERMEREVDPGEFIITVGDQRCSFSFE